MSNERTYPSVYVIRANEQCIKIGIAHNAQERLKSLHTAHYEHLELSHVLECNGYEAMTIEKEAHHILKDKRLAGEWFNATVEEGIAAIGEAMRVGRKKAESALNEKQSEPTIKEAQQEERRIIFTDDIPDWLEEKETATFIETKEVDDKTFINLAVIALIKGFRLSKKAGDLAHAIMKMASNNKATNSFNLSLDNLADSTGIYIKAMQLESAIFELVRHRLIYVTSKRDIYSINQKYFRTGDIINFVTVYDLQKGTKNKRRIHSKRQSA